MPLSRCPPEFRNAAPLCRDVFKEDSARSFRLPGRFVPFTKLKSFEEEDGGPGEGGETFSKVSPPSPAPFSLSFSSRAAGGRDFEA